MASGASAGACPGANSCPWTGVEIFGDVGAGEFRAPQGIAADAGGNLYVVEEDTNRVQKLDATGKPLAMWGGLGSSEGELDYPTDVAVDAGSGAVYVTDNNNNRIQMFDSNGEFVSAWGWGVTDGSAAYQVCTADCRAGTNGAGTGQLNTPTGIATDGVNVYVADQWNKRIQTFDLAGSFVGQWAIPGGQKPERIAVAGNDVYVTTRDNTVWRLDKAGVPDNAWDGDGVVGSSGSGAGQFNRPTGIAVDGSGVYVADSRNDRVEKLSLNGAFDSAWGSAGAGDGQFSQPGGILAGGGGVWVTDPYNHRLQKFSPAGAHQLTVGTPPGAGEFYYPTDVATIPSGGAYVADWSGHDIQRLDASGKSIRRWTTTGNVASVSPTATGVYAAESVDHVSLFDEIGNLTSQFGSSGSAIGQLGYPAGTATDGAGNVYVVERSNNRVQKFSPVGVPLASFGSKGAGDGQLNSPYDVAVDPAGNVYVSDTYNDRVEKFDPTGGFVAKWGSHGSGDGQLHYPTGIAVDAAGNLFVSDSANNRIEEFDAHGNFVATWGSRGNGPGELSTPAGLSLDSQGALWVADYYNHRIVRFCCPGTTQAPGSGGATPPPPAGGTAPSSDTTAPRVSLSGRATQRNRVVRRRGLAVRVATSEKASVGLKAVVSQRVARRLGLSSRTVARGAADLAEPGSRTLRLRIAARARRALPRLRSVRIVVRASAADAAGNRSSTMRAIRVKR